MVSRLESNQKSPRILRISSKNLEQNSPILQAKKNFEKVFYYKSPTTESSLASVSEIEALNLKFSKICEVLPIEKIEIIKNLIKEDVKDDKDYIYELQRLAAEILSIKIS